MKVGIRFGDNDFQEEIRAFMNIFILPTFIEREEGHFVTHLTSSMIVELFNTHIAYLTGWTKWYYSSHKEYYTNQHGTLEDCIQWYKNYLIIDEMNIYWDGRTDDYLDLDKNGQWTGSGGEFTWTDGKKVYP